MQSATLPEDEYPLYFALMRQLQWVDQRLSSFSNQRAGN